MGGCSAVGCKNRPERKVPGVTFHRFPKDTVLRAAWIVACRRKNWMPSRISLLCSEHFSEDLIDRTSLAIVRLRENAIPNIFKTHSEKSDCQKIFENYKPPLKHFASTPITTFFEDEETLTCDENISETTTECDVMDTAVSLDSPETESSNEYVLPVPIPKKRKSSEKRLAFEVARAFVNEVVQSSDESMSQTTTKCDVIKPIVVCLNPPANESSVENRPPLQIEKECNFPEKCLASTATIVSSNNEVNESGDESISDTSTEHGAMEPVVSLNSTVILPLQESDSEDYPSEDIETINLKRKLAEANKLISNYRKKIKYLQQQNRRYKQQLEKAKHSLSVLEKTNKSVFL